MDDAWIEKRKETRHQIEAIIYEAKAEVKLEILTLGEVKAKTMKGLHFYQEITKTEAQEITPRTIVKKKEKKHFSKR